MTATCNGPLTAREAASSVLGRFTTIMDAFDDGSTALSLDQVAAKASVPRSTTYRLLTQLVRLNWITHSTAGYCLGQRTKSWNEVNATAESRQHLREVAAPILHQLSLRAESAVVHLAVFEDGDIIHLDKLGGPEAACIPTRVGSRSHASRIALGLATLSALPTDLVVRHLTSPSDSASVAVSAAELDHVRRTRLAVRRDDYRPGWISLASSINPSASLGIVLPQSKYLNNHRALVVGAAAHVREALSRPTESVTALGVA
jgi:DNA-binding IclR family transcriptional regulator